MPAETHAPTRFTPLGFIYACIMALRRMLWTCGFFKATKPPVPCISVGNIAWGGTGKTPLVAWLMQWSLHHSLTPVVLSRGYKATIKNPPLHVQAHHNAKEVGDEPLMLALSCQGGHVIVDPHRRRAAKYAIQTLTPDLFILDDGMQHIALKRDLELVVLRPEDLRSQWNRVIPQGTWREGVSALSVADAFFIKIAPHEIPELEPAIMARLASFKRPVFTYYLIPTGLEPISTDTVELRPGQSPYAFMTGIGTPKQAIKTVSEFMGVPPSRVHTYPDHHMFTDNDLKELQSLDMPVICTSKDAARLRHTPIDFPLFALHVAVQFGQSFLTDDTSSADDTLPTPNTFPTPVTFPLWLTNWWTQHKLSKDNHEISS